MAKFRKGEKRPPNAGRKRGSRNVIPRELKDAIILAAEQLGDLSGIEDVNEEGVELGKDGLVGYLRWVAITEIPSFMRLLGRVMPLQEKESNATVREDPYESFEEIITDLAARGLSLDRLVHSLLDLMGPEVKSVDGNHVAEPRIEAVRTLDMGGSNVWGELVQIFVRTRAAHAEHEQAKAELKNLMPKDANEAIGHGLRATRSTSGSITFELLGDQDAALP